MRQALKKDAIPSQFSWTQPPTPTQQSRNQRAQKRQRDQESKDLPGIFLPDDYSVGAEIETVDTHATQEDTSLPTAEICTQTETTDTSDKFAQTDTRPPYSLDSFADDHEAVHFYTGLESYFKVCFVLSTLGPAQDKLTYIYGNIPHISIKDQFFLVLIKLRRYLTNFELSRMFGISEANVYNIVCTWVRFMALQWGELDIWPSRDIVRYFIPTDFKRKFPTTRAIIDGTECPIKRPSLPKAQQSTFSTYKNRNTLKVLVGSTPGGLISYVSPAFGGSTSDRQIIERSNIPSMCDPGDSIMADKGFNVQDIFAPYDVAINIPAFFKKQNRINSSTVVSDRKLASKRVHIERLIGLAKTYKILTNPLNQSETTLATDIIFVCFMLCNFRNGIVPRHA